MTNSTETTTIEITSKQATILRKLFALAPDSLAELHLGNTIMSDSPNRSEALLSGTISHSPVTDIQDGQLRAAMEVHQIFYAVQSILEGKF